jgi:hypothetical protein
MMTAALGTDIADPLVRLQQVSEKTASSKKQRGAVAPTILMDVAELVPSVVGRMMATVYRALNISSRHAPLFNCVVTNVPGPRDPLYMAGAKMISNFGIGPIFDGVGLIHPVLSYDDSITIAFTSCPTMIREPALYTECLRNAFEDLRAAVERSRPSQDSTCVVPLPRYSTG